MNGEIFNNLMTDNGYNQTTLAVRWSVTRQTIAKCCKSDVVDPLYADAVKAIAFEKQASKLVDIVNLFNDKD